MRGRVEETPGERAWTRRAIRARWSAPARNERPEKAPTLGRRLGAFLDVTDRVKRTEESSSPPAVLDGLISWFKFPTARSRTARRRRPLRMAVYAFATLSRSRARREFCDCRSAHARARARTRRRATSETPEALRDPSRALAGVSTTRSGRGRGFSRPRPPPLVGPPTRVVARPPRTTPGRRSGIAPPPAPGRRHERRRHAGPRHKERVPLGVDIPPQG